MKLTKWNRSLLMGDAHGSISSVWGYVLGDLMHQSGMRAHDKARSFAFHQKELNKKKD